MQKQEGEKEEAKEGRGNEAGVEGKEGKAGLFAFPLRCALRYPNTSCVMFVNQLYA